VYKALSADQIDHLDEEALKCRWRAAKAKENSKLTKNGHRSRMPSRSTMAYLHNSKARRTRRGTTRRRRKSETNQLSKLTKRRMMEKSTTMRRRKARRV